MRRMAKGLGITTLVILSYALGRAQGKTIDSAVISAPLATLAEQAAWGEFHAYYEGATTQTPAMLVGIADIRPGMQNHPPHKHADEEIIIIKEGAVEAEVNGQTRRLGPGGVIFEASNELHGLRNVGSGPAVYHVIRWTSPGARPLEGTR